MSVIRGSYTGTYNALNVGNTEAGFRQSYSYQGRNINFDSVGETPVDVIFAGINITVDAVFQEYDAPAIDLIRWPFTATPGLLDPAGLSMWAAAKPLILTSCTGVLPLSIEYPKAILAPEYSLDIDFSHRERPVPMRFIILPVQFEALGDYSSPSLPNGCEDVVYFVETN